MSTLPLHVAPAQRSPAERWLPGAVGLGVFVAALVLWQALEKKQNQQIAQTVRAGAESVSSQLKGRVETRTLAFKRMSRRWEFAGEMSQAAWEDDAQGFVRDFPELQSLEWRDTAHRVRWIVPLEGNEAKLNLDMTVEERRRRALATAELHQQPAITEAVTLFRGGLGYVVYVPIKVRSESAGFIAAVFPAQAAFDQYLPKFVAEGNSILISQGGQTIFVRNAGPLPPHPEWIVDSHIELLGATWDVRVWPTPAFIAQIGSPLPQVALATGFVGALLLALTTYLAQAASRRAQKNAVLYQTLLAAQAEVKTLSGLLPICSDCKRIKDEEGHWTHMERYVSKRSAVSFSHGYCPECAIKFCELEGLRVPAHLRAELVEGQLDP